MIARIRSLARTLFSRRRFEDEMQSEMEFHIESYTEDLIRSGVAPEEARRQARIQFGSMNRVEEQCRRARGLMLLDEATRNMRFTFRTFRRNPLFMLTAVLTLGICIGVNSAVFSIVDAVLWRPLPYPDPANLALVAMYTDPVSPYYQQLSHDGRTWELVRDNAQVIDCAVFTDWITGVNLAGEGSVAHVRQQRVSAGFFRVLGVPPLMGRGFSDEEDRPGGLQVTVLSYELWDRIFVKDAEIIGKSILLKGESHTVIGIMPEGFESNAPADLWTPVRPSLTGEGEGKNYGIIARVPAGTNWEQASAVLASIDLGIPLESEESTPPRLDLVPLQHALTTGIRRPLLFIFGTVLVMLLVGCANLAALMLARAVSRRSEVATRMALGGGARAILRQMLVESAVLGVIGGIVGLVAAYFGMKGLELLARTQFEIWQTARLDLRVVAATFCFTILACLVFGIAPALQASRTDIRSALVGSGTRAGTGRSGHRLQRVFLVAELSLVAALLFGAVLLTRGYLRLERLEPGFDHENVLTLQVSLEDARYATRSSVERLFTDSVERIRNLPGVESAAAGLYLPYERGLNLGFQLLDGDEPVGEMTVTNVNYVTPEYFTTLGIPLLGGRLLESTDTAGAPPVVLVNQSFAEMYLSDTDVVGTVIGLSNSPRTIVGIVGNTQQVAGWGNEGPVWPSPTVYMPVAQTGDRFLQIVHTWFSPSWLVRTSGRQEGIAAAIQGIITDIDPQLPVSRILNLPQLTNESLARWNFQALFVALIALVALLLAAVGIYGMVANTVLERTSELGVRMALGATPQRAVLSVAIPGVRLALVGLLLGGAISALIAPALQHLVWGVGPFEPATFALMTLCLMVVAVLASFIPAIRVSRLNPARTLREE